MSQLKINLEEIKRQKDVYLLPENIKKDLTILGVTGTLEGGSIEGAKLFNSIQEMNQDPNPVEDGLAVVYYPSIETLNQSALPVTIVSLPQTIVLSTRVTSQYNFYGGPSSYQGCYLEIDLDPVSCRLWNQMQYNDYAYYTSSDGITYTKQTGQDIIDFRTTQGGDLGVFYPGWESNTLCLEFLQINSYEFQGLYKYNSINNRYELAPTQLSADSETVCKGKFYGKKGLEEGNLNNTTNLNEEQLKNRVLAYNNLSYLNINSGITTFYNLYAELSLLKYIPNLNSVYVTNMSRMFGYCYNLLSVANFDTSNVRDMSYMFQGCNNISTVPNFNTINTTNIAGMFSGCFSLTSVPQFNTSNVTNMRYMFSSCYNLTSIPQFNTRNITNIRQMFISCNNLSDASIQNIINMCLNSGVTNSTLKNLNNSNSYSPLYYTNISNTRYQNRWSELTASGWSY